jgi:hypothetical protein
MLTITRVVLYTTYMFGGSPCGCKSSRLERAACSTTATPLRLTSVFAKSLSAEHSCRAHVTRSVQSIATICRFKCLPSAVLTYRKSAERKSGLPGRLVHDDVYQSLQRGYRVGCPSIYFCLSEYQHLPLQDLVLANVDCRRVSSHDAATSFNIRLI